MKELLEQHGYKFIGTCNCDGHHTEKYRNGDYKVKWRTGQGRFQILKHGHIIFNWQPISNKHLLNEFIQEKV